MTPSAALAAKGAVLRYEGTNRAIVRGAHSLITATSSVPLRVAKGNGPLKPVSLKLRPSGDSYVPVNPLAPVAISQRLSGGVRVGSDGIAVVPDGRNVAGQLVSSDTVFFPTTGKDEDVVAVPTIGGAELSTILRSSLSPTLLGYHVSLPAGATLQLAGAGAVISRGAQVLARVRPPTARDADGRGIPVTLRVAGQRLVLTVSPNQGHVAYPLLVDPEIVTITGSSAHWHFSGSGTHSLTGEVPVTIATEGDYPSHEPCFAGKAEPPCGSFQSDGSWIWELESSLQPATAPTTLTTEFQSVSYSASTPEDHPLAAGWNLYGQCLLESSELVGVFETGEHEPPPSTVVTHASCRPDEIRAVVVDVETGQHENFFPGEAVPQIHAANAISVGAIVVYEELPVEESPGSESYGEANDGEPGRTYCLLGGTNCATGNSTIEQTDIEMGGHGPGLEFTRTYNSQLAATQNERGEPGLLGYGWDFSYDASLKLGGGVAVVHQDNGSTVSYLEKPGGTFQPASPLIDATLAKEGSSYVYTLSDQTKLVFGSNGTLTREVDRNGNAITPTYEEYCEEEAHGFARSAAQTQHVRADTAAICRGTLVRHPIALTDSAGRKITITYNGNGQIETVIDPMGHTVHYGHSSQNLTSVLEPGDAHAWEFKYASDRELTSETDPRGLTTTIEYDTTHRTIKQVDPEGHTRKWSYTSTEAGPTTTITEPNGSTSSVVVNSLGLIVSTTIAAGTSAAETTKLEYDESANLTKETDPKGETTTYGYDADHDRTSVKNPLGHTWTRAYDTTHDITEAKAASGATTTFVRDGHGNITEKTLSASGMTSQATKHEYNGVGDVVKTTDPRGASTSYTYDSYGDRISETDPEGDKRTWTYNENGQETSSVSPRGNATGADPAEYTTTFELDQRGRQIGVQAPSAGESARPTSVTSPVISGTIEEGQTLSASTGIWKGAIPLIYGYQWQRCNSTGEGCVDITGATNTTYSPGSSDVGGTLKVSVTARNPAGAVTASSHATVAVPTSTPVFGSQFGSLGSGSGQMRAPKGIALDSKGDVVVADENNSRVDVFNEEGEFVRTIGTAGSGSGQLKEPRGVAVDSKDDVWVADSSNNRVEEFTNTGEFVRTAGSVGSGTGHFKEPKGIAIDSHDDVWVADTYNNRVQELSKEGTYLKTVGSAGSGAGQLAEPRTLMVTKDGRIWVADTGNSRIEVFKENGEYEKTVGSPGTGDGQFSEPKGIAEDPAGNVWVSDTENGRIEEFDATGKYVTQFGKKGSGAGELNEPWGIQADSHGDFYIADAENNRIQKWTLRDTQPTISGELIPGQTLTATSGHWLWRPTPTFTYQWQRCDTSGTHCTNIAGANTVSYVPTKADEGDTIRVDVGATNATLKAEATSAATETVTRPPIAETRFDPDGNVEASVSASGNTTSYAYNADNQPTITTLPDGAKEENTYDAAGERETQTNAAGHETTYVHNAAEQVIETVDGLHRTTTVSYDKCGHLVETTDPEGHTTKYSYDDAGQPTEVAYSEAATHAVKYTYDADERRTQLIDGSGTTTYTYDAFGRMTQTEDGHGDVVKYEYDSAGQLTKLTYPNGKAVERTFDNAGRLSSVTDWAERTTHFGYNADSEPTTTEFPSATGETDVHKYGPDGHTTEIDFDKGTEALAKLAYQRNQVGQVTHVTQTGLPGEEASAITYDANGRLEEASGTNYKYDDAGSPTKIGSTANSFDAAGQLSKSGTTGYGYDEEGARTSQKPASGATTTYTFNQALELTGVTRPAEGATPAVEDSYAYNGDGLRVSQTAQGATSFISWDYTSAPPEILSDGTNSYIYGPADEVIEQVSNTGAVRYLHHDEQGSARLLTGSTGTTEATFSYDAYGNLTGRTGTASAPLGYDGQYTSSDTGLIYLRAREYDPSTAQFLSVDPAVRVTLEAYGYAGDDPLNRADPAGQDSPAPEEVAFVNAYTHARVTIERRLRGEAKEDFIETANYYYFAVKTEIAMNNNNLSYATYDQQQEQEIYAEFGRELLHSFAPLVKAETVSGWKGVVESFVKIANKIYNIRVSVRPVAP
ncbi:MAG TPA: RHS repeat-associated core domain-containing protein [Solirubrobacteraceae bacterium]|nr:RHS repeat-associated core domain-containing protein [Solirubrobacteraceae bacterium]